MSGPPPPPAPKVTPKVNTPAPKANPPAPPPPTAPKNPPAPPPTAPKNPPAPPMNPSTNPPPPPNNPSVNPPAPPQSQQKSSGGPSWKLKRQQEESQKESQFNKLKSWNLRPGDLQDPDWSNILNFRRSSEGSAGVFFVDRATGTVVIKGSMTMVAEIFTGRLAQMIGIQSPNMRVVDWSADSPEWGQIKHQVFKFVEAHYGKVDSSKVAKELDRATFLIMDVVIGKNLDSIEPETLTSLFTLSAQTGLTSRIHTIERLRSLGHLVALDIFCNNWDRLPVIWKNDGNLNNIFIDLTEKVQVVAIDNGIVTIRKGAHREEYFMKVRKFLDEVTRNVLVEHPSLKTVREVIKSSTHCDIEVEGSLQIQLGILEGIMRILSSATPQQCKELHNSLPKLIKHDWENVWMNAVNDIDPSFLETLWGIFKEYEPILSKLTTDFPVQSVVRSQDANITAETVKVLVCQLPINLATYEKDIVTLLQKEKDTTNRYPDFIIFPEFWITKAGKATLDHPILRSLADISKAYALYIIAGSMEEVVEGKRYNSTVTIGPDGEIIGVYRKRFPISNTYTPGTQVALYDSKFGKFGVLICFDAENTICLTETLAENPFVIFNPTWIPLIRTLVDPSDLQQKFQWKTAVDMMRRNFEYLTWKHSFTLIRADVPYPGAMGSSQSIGPYCSIVTSSMFPTHFTVHIDLNIKNQFYGLNYPPADRTAIEDNTGNRYVVHILPSTGLIKTINFIGKKAMRFFFASGDSKGNVDIWDNLKLQAMASTKFVDPIEQILKLEDNVSTPHIPFLVSFSGSKQIGFVSYSIDTNTLNSQITQIPFVPKKLLRVENNGYVVLIGHQFEWAIMSSQMQGEPKLLQGELKKSKQTMKAIANTDKLIAILLTNGKLQLYHVTASTITLQQSVKLNIGITSMVFRSDSSLLVGDENGGVHEWVIGQKGAQILLSALPGSQLMGMVGGGYSLISCKDSLFLLDLLKKRIYHHFKVDQGAAITQLDQSQEAILTNDSNNIPKLITFIQNQNPLPIKQILSQ